MTDLVVILVTTASAEEAERIGKALVEERLAACANLVPGIRSFFFWEGRLNDEGEALLILKSKATLLPKIEARVKELHSYQVPEVIALPILSGSAQYLKWVEEELGGTL